jgi:hypothetical protein
MSIPSGPFPSGKGSIIVDSPMKSELLVGLLIVMALTVGAALGFMAEQADQPSDLDLSQSQYD